MTQAMVQLVMGALGSIGFGILFNLNRRYLPAAALGGVLGWLVYLVSYHFLGTVLFPNLLAGCATAIYAEILARTYNAPSTPFFIISAIPLIPGRGLYYCMDAVVHNDLPLAQQYGRDTFLVALGISGGMAIAWCLVDLNRKVHAAIRRRQ